MNIINYKVVLASALVALAGCSATDDPEDIQDNNNTNQTEENVPISFGSYLGSSNANLAKTRADGSDATTTTGTDASATAKLASEGFGVFAYFTGTNKYADETEASKTPNFMYNTKVADPSAASKSSGSYTWTYTPVRYWPNPTRGNNGSIEQQYVSFFAYAPYTTVTPSTGAATATTGITSLSSNSATGDPVLNFTHDGTTDLLWGASSTTGSVNEDLTKQNINEKVTFHFKHALAELSGMTVDLMADQISGVSEDVNNDSTRVTVKSITITPTVSGSGVLNLAKGTWSANTTTTESATTTLSSSSLNSTIAEPASMDGMSSIANGWAATMPAGVSTTAQNVASSFTPVTFIPNADNTSFNITIDYIVRTHDWTLAKGYTEVEQTVTNSVKFSTLEANKRYTIRIHLGLTSVKFDAVVSDWEDGGSSATVDLPVNTSE